MPDLRDVQKRHDAYIDSLLESFERELWAITSAALARSQARMSEALATTGGRVDRTAGNIRAVRRLDRILIEEMDRAGLGALLDEFVAQFPGQLPYFRETLEMLSAAMKTPLPRIEFGPRDLQVFGAQAEMARDGLAATVESVAVRARNRVLLSIGGARLPDLAVSIAKSFSRGLPEAVGIAETAASSYYRVIADRGYRLIEKDHPEKLRYKFEGPLDSLTRPFCARLVGGGKSYTRAQIDRMNNGQIPNVFISGGGYRCRHQWVISIEE